MYALMIVIGVIFGGLYFFLVTLKEEKFSQLTLKRLLISIILSAICLVIGAALFDSLFHSIEEGRPVIGGITWLGGVVVAFPAFVFLSGLLIPDAKGRAMKFVSLLIPSIVLAHAFGRLGCFFGGCCYGKVTDSIFGVKFPFLDEKVLPTQLFEAIFDLFLFTVMAVFRKKIRYHNFEIYFMSYGVFRFFIEFLRGDDRGATNSVFSPAQLLSIVIIVAGIIITYRYILRRNIDKQLSVSIRDTNPVLFASEEEFVLKLSWRNGAIILTSLALVLFLASCGQNSCDCFHNCGLICENCVCPGILCNYCGCDLGIDEAGTAIDQQGVDESAKYMCNCACDACKNTSNCSCELFNDCIDACRNPNCDSDADTSLANIKNVLSAFLSFAKEMVYHY